MGRIFFIAHLVLFLFNIISINSSVVETETVITVSQVPDTDGGNLI